MAANVSSAGGGGGEETLTQTQKEILVELRKSLGTLRVMVHLVVVVWWKRRRRLQGRLEGLLVRRFGSAVVLRGRAEAQTKARQWKDCNMVAMGISKGSGGNVESVALYTIVA
ncbi:unnamed protein product [Tuber melanosporum]|uniref:(Perigord truffle) hypothetical protein n=1 Tax=Tuber melanosporum (strain Mel28) TaxID=656061 RepID=D5GJ85_TUBMM|nr:uncharacterized protein GSTUM_00008881001 [Tuber melanosporum]CAZ84578.1 unnamed protein product [Tuber melanosporum]